ncbi:SDR family oxidoreductase [Haliangium sp.]|uniref:SDR family oxidoreductase n=1 Tax=Haliangium sp. TaxID=2663208 RepID=UPI003D0A5280
MTKTLVTGATGTVGSHVVRALRANGLDVRAGARDPQKLTDLAGLGAETVRLDFDQPATLAEAFAGVTRVFLLTPFVEDDRPLVQAGLAAAKEAGVEFVLRMSAAGADPNAEAELPKHHGQNEEAVKSSGLAWAIIRPNFFQDNYVNYNAASIKAQGAFYGAGGDGKVSYVSAADIAAAAAAILADPAAHGAQTYVLTGPEALSDGDGATLLSELLGRKVEFVNLSSDDLGAGLRSQGMPAWQVASLQYLENVKAQGWAAAVSPAVEQLTGRAPETMRAFLERNRAAFL